MRIDSHQHFWKYNPVRDAWIDDTMNVLKRDFLPNDLLPILSKHDIDGCIAVQADTSETETQFLLDLAEKNDFIKGVVGWIDLLDRNVEERLAYFSKFEKLKGIRYIIQSEPEKFLLREDFTNGIAILGKFNLSYDILIFPQHLPNTLELVSKFPNQIFVLDHLAKPYIKEGKIDLWERDIKALAKFENVFCKVSGMVTEAHWEKWKTKDFVPYLDVVFNAFGIDRVLFGSDWPVCLLAAPYKEMYYIVTNYVSSFTKEEQGKFYGQNAVKVYKLA